MAWSFSSVAPILGCVSASRIQLLQSGAAPSLKMTVSADVLWLVSRMDLVRSFPLSSILSHRYSVLDSLGEDETDVDAELEYW